jgi:hypothetical protein
MSIKKGLYSSAHDLETVFEITVLCQTKDYVKIARIQGGTGPMSERSYFGWISKQRFAADYRFLDEIPGE